MGSLLGELKRRRVFKVDTLYALAAWVRLAPQTVTGNNEQSQKGRS